MNAADWDGDGTVDFGEFRDMAMRDMMEQEVI